MKHFLIVGGGVAGYSLTIALLNKNTKVTVLDSDENHGSAVAAGQINPIVFRRMNKSWRADEYMPVARNLYEELESFSETVIIVDKQIRRLFAHDQERDEWLKRQELPEYEMYLEKLSEDDLNFSQAINICGSGRVKQSYYVHAKNFLSACQNYVSNHENGAYRKSKVNHSLVDAAKIEYKKEAFSGIIFCEGYKNFENPFFNFLQVDCTKGQLITVRSPIYKEESLNRKCFVMPIGSGEYKVGSTYEWNQPNVKIDDAAKELLRSNLASLVSERFEIIDQIAGIRPTVKDRRPIMGEHPDLSGLYIFNGLGAKGYMMAPLLGQELAEFILRGTELNKEVRLNRFKKKC